MRELRLLFTGAGRRIELVRAFREAAFVRDIHLSIYGCDMSAEAPVLAFCDHVRGIVAMKDPAYIDELLAICVKDQIDLVIPTIDTDLLVLSENRKRFLSAGTRVLISDPDKIRLCRDKNLTGDFFRSCGLLAPETVHEAADYEGPFPAFIKPKDGSSSIDAHPVPDKETLLHYAKTVPGYVIQPLIRGKEYTIDLCCDFDGRIISIVPRQRLKVRDGEVLHTKVCMDAVMITEAEKLIRAFRPAGPLTVQLIREEGTGLDYFIEINPRFGGGAPLSMKAGADTAGALLACLLREKEGDSSAGAQERQTAASAVAAAPTSGKTVLPSLSYIETARIADGAVYHRFDDSVMITPGERPRPLRGILFDLDDTLYPEKDYVRSGYDKIAAYLGDPAYADRLWQYFTDGAPAVDRLLAELDRTSEKEACLRVYRTQEPEIALAEDVRKLLETLRARGLKTGILTDGRVEGQEAKLRALGLYDLVDDVVITDALGGVQFRKPCDIAYRIVQRKWRLPFAEIAYVGDNPKKDFIAPLSLGMRALYVPNEDGLYYEPGEQELFAGITRLHRVTDIERHVLTETEPVEAPFGETA